MDGPIVHSSRMGREIILFALDHLAGLSFGNFQSRYPGQHFLFASMPQLVAQRLGPLRSGGFIILVESAPQTPQVFAGMIEIEQLGCSLPTVLGDIPNPRSAITNDQPGAGAP